MKFGKTLFGIFWMSFNLNSSSGSLKASPINAYNVRHALIPVVFIGRQGNKYVRKIRLEELRAANASYELPG